MILGHSRWPGKRTVLLQEIIAHATKAKRPIRCHPEDRAVLFADMRRMRVSVPVKVDPKMPRGVYAL